MEYGEGAGQGVTDTSLETLPHRLVRRAAAGHRAALAVWILWTAVLPSNFPARHIDDPRIAGVQLTSLVDRHLQIVLARNQAQPMEDAPDVSIGRYVNRAVIRHLHVVIPYQQIRRHRRDFHTSTFELEKPANNRRAIGTALPYLGRVVIVYVVDPLQGLVEHDSHCRVVSMGSIICKPIRYLLARRSRKPLHFESPEMAA